MQLLQHPPRSLVLLVCLLACACGLARAQTPVAQQLDVFFGDTKLLPIDRPIDSFKVEPDNIVKVEKSDGAPNQLSIVGMNGGNAMLTIQSDGRTLLYAITVSPAPERLYINLDESKRLSFPNPIDDTSLSTAGVVRIVQPDTTDKVLLLEAQAEGKTTLTVYSNKEIYRYFISTFANRGADILEIQNSFSAKGYRNLTISFDKDQATVGGSVPTQEELDDAIRIVKQFTDYVQVKATVGQEVDTSDAYSLQAQIVINNIQRIANVKGLTVRVKYPAPTVVTTSTYTKSIGDYIAPGTTTTPQGGTIRGGGFEPPNPDQNQGPNNGGPTELKPQENTTQTTTTTENTTLPEKIFLYGDLEDDLDEAKVLRVARTFCPFIVNFLTIKDPIQIRTQIRFMQVSKTDQSETGFFWQGGGPNLLGPSFTLGFGPGAVANSFLFTGGNNPAASVASLLNGVSYGVSGAADAQAIFTLMENLDMTKELQTADLFLTNGQPGWFSEGEIQTYVANVTSVVGGSTTNTTASTSTIFFGLNLDVAPLNVAAAGGVESPGQQILGIPGSLNGGSVSATPGPGNTADPIGKVNAIGAIGNPFIDSTTKYVDENGMIGMNVSTQLTLPSTPKNAIIDGITTVLPDYFVRTTKTRLNMRDGQTVTIDGLIDQELTKSITQVPFLSSIPLFGNLFKGHEDNSQNNEVIVLVTPHIIRMRDPNSARYPKPVYPEMQKLASEYGDIPIIKPVRYDAEAVDIRPESPKDMKDSKNDTADSAPAPAPPSPRASGGMQTLQPPAESTAPAPSAVDKTPRAPDISRQPSSAPLAPSSTLP
jgi:Flp pilus assembly secretin CpaC